MLKKLLGYDLKYIFKFLVVFYSLAMFFAILTRAFSCFENSLVVTIIAEICTGAAISMMCSSLINNLMRMWVRFKGNLYGDESYLSHTLPVEKSTHYFSKIITAVITLFATFLIIGIVLFVGFYSKESLEHVKVLLIPAVELFDSSALSIVAVLLGLLFLEFVNILQCGFTGIILGHRMNSAKTGLSVLFGFIAYIVSQGAVVAVLAVGAIFNDGIMNLFVTKTAIDLDLLKLVVVIAILIYIAINVILCIINIKLFKKGVNVD